MTEIPPRARRPISLRVLAIQAILSLASRFTMKPFILATRINFVSQQILFQAEIPACLQDMHALYVSLECTKDKTKIASRIHLIDFSRAAVMFIGIKICEMHPAHS